MTQDNVYRDGPITPQRANQMLGKIPSHRMAAFQQAAAADAAPLYLEAHITIEPVFGAMRETAAKLARRQGFRLAELLMQKEREETVAMTGHSKSRDDITARTQSLVTDLRSYGIKVWRYKIEDTLIDSRHADEWSLLTGAVNGERVLPDELYGDMA